MNEFVLFLVGIIFHFTSWSMLEPIVPLFVLHLGGSTAMVGVVSSAASLMPLIGAVWIGGVTARMGTKISLVLGGIGAVGSFVLFAISRDIRMLIVAQALFGLAHLWRIIPAQTWISNGSGSNLYRNFGYYAFAVTTGQLIGPPLGGWLLQHSEGLLPGEHSGYMAAFGVGAILLLVSAVIHLFLPEPPKGQEQAQSQGGFRHVLAVARQREFTILTVVSVLIWMGIALRRSYFPVYLDMIGLSPLLVGIVLSAYSLVSMTMRPLLGFLVERVGPRRLLYGSFGLATAVLLGIPLSHAFVPLVGMAAVWGFTHGTGMPVVMAMSTQVVAPADRGLAVGLRVGANRLGEGVGPLLYGLVASVMGIPWTFVAASGVMVVGLFFTTLVARDPARQSTENYGSAYKG